MQAQNKNGELMEAIERHNVKAVRACLERSADPNYFRPSHYKNPEQQPTTPLRLVMFCLSNNLLGDEDLKQFGEIADF